MIFKRIKTKLSKIEFEGLIDDEYFYMDETPVLNGNPYFYIDYDEFAHDKLCIYEKPVMKFNMEEC